MAGGHLGFHKEQIGELTPEIYAEEVKEIIAVVRKYEEKDLPDLIRIWNEVVEDGVAFPQEECLNEETGKAFFSEQTYTAAAVDAERRLGSVSSNGGKIVYDMVLINTGKKEIEGKTIGEAWNLLKRKTDGQIH